jgi:FKBP-type peptidyl-prolyl cis-trans isomerase 2
VASTRKRPPVELTVGVDHPRLPGLGMALVGLAPGSRTTVRVPAEQAGEPADPARIHRWARARFPEGQALTVGRWVQVRNSQGRRRRVRIVEVRGRHVLVDTNRPGAGQPLDLEVELVSIRAAGTGP